MTDLTVASRAGRWDMPSAGKGRAVSELSVVLHEGWIPKAVISRCLWHYYRYRLQLRGLYGTCTEYPDTLTSEGMSRPTWDQWGINEVRVVERMGLAVRPLAKSGLTTAEHHSHSLSEAS